MKTVNIIINNQPYKALEGDTIYNVAAQNGIHIPTLCHDPRLDPFSSCFVCVVEVEGMRNMQPSCSTRVQEGMVIHTESEKAKASRKTALELMLSNHFADCMAPCKQTCPAGVDVQGYISLIEKGLYSRAIELIKEVNPLPAICGRVCVRPCEVACRRNLLDEGAGVGIDYLKRFAADRDMASDFRYKGTVAPATGKKVAIIGAGPGGLSTAWFLQTKGHECQIFEAAPKPGGWLRYGIPEYRLPNDVLDAEVAAITELGTQIHYNQKLGNNLSYETLAKDFDATVLAIGSQTGTLLGCEGDDATNVFSGIDFLRNMELTGQRYNFAGKTVVVVGGGNTAMDCCRTAKRCGAEKVYVVYRRTENEMPANPIEIHESKIEGVEYLFLTNPTKVNKTANGELKSLTLIKMELGEPDASGRRRPVPMEGSEYELNADYILAAIGQKTNVNFIDDINRFAANGKLAITRWGDIEANKHTLQTGIPSVFAAGDGVSGPATIIEAIAQAKKASLSCHQYLTGLPIEPPMPEFLSKKDNFKKQIATDYKGYFASQKRKEMPVLASNLRLNFNEVELGYDSPDVALSETARCLECGCTEINTCDLKRYSTEYNATQTRFNGEFHQHRVDFSHPYIEIDNNKCIVCGRCVRICNEQAGIKALGLVQRGFNTYVAPSMGNSLTESNCDSCGLCISTCPTGAITENKPFKPGPVKPQTAQSICHYCGMGCAIEIEHTDGFVWGVNGAKGLMNPDTSVCRYAKFGYRAFSEANRITKPLLKENGKFIEITFAQAYNIIAKQIGQGIQKQGNAFFAGTRLTNEEMFLIQKLARAGAHTNQVASFYHFNAQTDAIPQFAANVELNQFETAGRVVVMGANLNAEHGVMAYKLNNLRYKLGLQVELVHQNPDAISLKNADAHLKPASYLYFIKAVNHYLLSNHQQNEFYIGGNTVGFETYKTALLSESYPELVKKSGIEAKTLEAFANRFNEEQNAIVVFSDKFIESHCRAELLNLLLITGKLGKTASGWYALHQKNNAQGLLDMGINPQIGVGANKITDPAYFNKLRTEWGITNLADCTLLQLRKKMEEGLVKNLFMFGEDPVGCAINKTEVIALIKKSEFVVVQDFFRTETAELANLILPASLPAETGGTFSSSGRIIQQLGANMPSSIIENSLMQLAGIMQELGLNSSALIEKIQLEMFGFIEGQKNSKFGFESTSNNCSSPQFKAGCDALVNWLDAEIANHIKQ